MVFDYIFDYKFLHHLDKSLEYEQKTIKPLLSFNQANRISRNLTNLLYHLLNENNYHEGISEYIIVSLTLGHDDGII